MLSWYMDARGSDRNYGRSSDSPLRTLEEISLRSALAPYLEGRVVHDLGCGPTFKDALRLLSCDAKEVIGVDCEKVSPEFLTIPQVSFTRRVFSEVTEDIDVAYCSWPLQRNTGLSSLIERASMVVYVGRNTGGTVCGSRAFWKKLATRQVVHYLPQSSESLIVYGSLLRCSRELLPEEQAARSAHAGEDPWTFNRVLAMCR